MVSCCWGWSAGVQGVLGSSTILPDSLRVGWWEMHPGEGPGQPRAAPPRTLWAAPLSSEEQLGRSLTPGSLPLSESGNHGVG